MTEAIHAMRAPFCIRFTGSVRPDKFPYCIVDSWNGAYQTDNTMLLSGTRAYVNNKGAVQVTFLGHRDLQEVTGPRNEFST